MEVNLSTSAYRLPVSLPILLLDRSLVAATRSRHRGVDHVWKLDVDPVFGGAGHFGW
jgi:hypothetical protein